MGFMPKKCDGLAGHVLDRPICIMVAVGSREDDDAKLHLISSEIRLLKV
jgi:hypothetical protein